MGDHRWDKANERRRPPFQADNVYGDDAGRCLTNEGLRAQKTGDHAALLAGESDSLPCFLAIVDKTFSVFASIAVVLLVVNP